MMDRFPVAHSESLTALAIWARYLCGAEGDDPAIRKGVDLCLGTLPKWDSRGRTTDFYYGHFGTLALFQRGGTEWRAWNDALKKALVPNRHADSQDHRFGSGDPADPWAADGGRIYATAINTLTLETYYRNARLRGR